MENKEDLDTQEKNQEPNLNQEDENLVQENAAVSEKNEPENKENAEQKQDEKSIKLQESFEEKKPEEPEKKDEKLPTESVKNEKIEEPEKKAEQPQNTDIASAFSEINSNLDDVEKSLEANVSNFTKVKENLDRDFVKLCTNYLLGPTSPLKGKVDIGLISNKVSPIKRMLDQSPPEAERDISPQENEEDINNNDVQPEYEDQDYNEPDNAKYNEAILSQKFWKGDAGKLSYHREEPIGQYKYSYQPAAEPRIGSGNRDLAFMNF